jgi:hypothetical protein
VARDKQLKVWVDSIVAARLTVRAEESGTSLSQYVGNLIAREGELAGRADALDGSDFGGRRLKVVVRKAGKPSPPR